MKKNISHFLLILCFCWIIAPIAKAEGNYLNLIIGTKGQYSGETLNLVQEKINSLSGKLELTEEQKHKAEEIGVNSDKKLNIYRVQFIEEKKKLIEMRKNNAPLQQIQAQVKVIRSLKSRLSITRNKNIEEFRTVLTDDQQKKFDKFREELKQIKQTERNSARKKREVPIRDESLQNLEELN